MHINIMCSLQHIHCKALANRQAVSVNCEHVGFICAANNL